MTACQHCGRFYDGNDTMCGPCTQIAYCSDQCTRPATTGRLVAVSVAANPSPDDSTDGDGITEVVELVCSDHKAPSKGTSDD